MTESVTEPALASDGRIIGARAHRTRRRLLDATAKLLEERGALGLRVVDITREVGTSPATFYQYFPDVEEAILVLADEATDDIEALHPFIQTPLERRGRRRPRAGVRGRVHGLLGPAPRDPAGA